MRPRIGTGSSSVVRSPAAAGLVLLFLICHAFIVSATHFHRDVLRPGAQVATPGLSAGRDDGAEQTNLAGGHAQCLLCRLQRNFICDLEQGIPATPAPPAGPPRREDLTTPFHSRTFYLTHSGRGPPST